MKSSLVLMLLLSSCTIGLAPAEVAQSLRDANFRCVSAEPDMTVLSPYSPGMTQSLIRDVREVRAACEALFDVELPLELLVSFREVEMEGARFEEEGDGSWNLTGVERASEHGVLGYSTNDVERPEVSFFVPSSARGALLDGSQPAVEYHFGLDLVMRHEMAHACAKQAGLFGDTWFNEGLAEEIEHREFDAAGRLVPSRMNVSLRRARDGHGDFTIDDVLDWNENAWVVVQGDEVPFKYGRPLSHSLIRFLLGRTPGASLTEKFRRILALDKDEIRAMEPEWKAWLNALPE